MRPWKDRQREAGIMDLTLFCVAGASDGLGRVRSGLWVAFHQADSTREKRALLKLARDVDGVHARVQAAKYRMATRRRAKLATKAEA